MFIIAFDTRKEGAKLTGARLFWLFKRTTQRTNNKRLRVHQIYHLYYNRLMIHSKKCQHFDWTMTNKKGLYSLNSKKTKDNIGLEDRSSINQSQRDYIYVSHLTELSLSGKGTAARKSGRGRKKSRSLCSCSDLFKHTG